MLSRDLFRRTPVFWFPVNGPFVKSSPLLHYSLSHLVLLLLLSIVAFVDEIDGDFVELSPPDGHEDVIVSRDENQPIIIVVTPSTPSVTLETSFSDSDLSFFCGNFHFVQF